MKTCPHCGVELAPPKEKFPAKLTKNHEKILAFCRSPRSAKEIADGLGFTMSAIYRHLRFLQRLDQLDRLQAPNAGGHNHGVTFQATGKPVAFDPNWMQYTPSPDAIVCMGVRL